MTKNFISERLTELREQAGLSKTALAEALGMPYSSYTHYEYRFKDPYLPVDMAEKIAAVLSRHGVPRQAVMELAGVVEPRRYDIDEKAPPTGAMVPVYDLSASAGHGAMVGYEAIAYSLAFPPAYLEKITRSNPRHLVIISVKGDSMVPTLHDDDVVMIDTSKKNVDFDGLFVFRFGDALHVKRVARSAKRGRVLAISDNRALYDPMEYDIDDIEVIGRVIWYGRKV